MKNETLDYLKIKTAHNWLLFSLMLSLIGAAGGVFQFSVLLNIPMLSILPMATIILGWVITIGLGVAYFRLLKRQEINSLVFKAIYGLYALEFLVNVITVSGMGTLISALTTTMTDIESYFYMTFASSVFNGVFIASLILKCIPILITVVTDNNVKVYNALIKENTTNDTDAMISE